MRARFLKAAAALTAIVLIVMSCMAPVAALEDKYKFEALGMSVNVPKNLDVITLDTPREDEVFTRRGTDYDVVMTAFRNANIYLCAYDPDGVYQISLTVTADDQSKVINNYSDITAADRKDIINTLLQDPSVSSAVEVKHGGNIFFDSARVTTVEDRTVYINQSNTIINGMQIDLTLQKYDESILPDENKVLTAMATSLNFDKIIRKTGLAFDWWRVLLWIVILVVLSVGISILYRRYNAANRRKLEERRRKRLEARMGEQPAEEPSFEEVLGYENTEEYETRADTDLDTYDISVKDKDPSHGISYFEDEGDSIDDGTDYFDTFFKEPTEQRSATARFFSTIGAYIQIAWHRTKYFFRNLYNTIFKKK